MGEYLTFLSSRLTSQLLNPETLAEVFPNWEALQNPDTFFFRVLSGISSGILYTVFFSFCPQLFKAIANFHWNVSRSDGWARVVQW
jgi:hypothetical protein